mgnify:FL=1|jgi:hypothetical protein|tara:strand:+ start:79 stop:327 length:249 start_codon:yes stop_codon:yes gene_type:complete
MYGILLRMSPFSRSLMKHKHIDDRSPGFYDPERAPAKTNAIVTVVAFVLFGAAAFYSISTTLDQQQRQHCEQGWQPACEALK